MIEKVRSYMEKYKMFPQNGNIVAGISGGADSVCLLRVLAELRKEYHFNLTAVHVNHQIRREAGEDARFTEELCRKWEVPLVIVEEDVEALAEREHLSCEEAGRLVRYQAFEQVLLQCSQKDGGCIAVAHNRDDRAETFLFHLFRGTGLRGMGSIRPVRDMENGGRLIRPLLFVPRSEIEAFLQQEGFSWCVDSTNQEDIYTRNRIRNRILPYAQQQICQRSAEHLARESELLAETADYVERMTNQAMGRCCARSKEGSLAFDVKRFGQEDSFLQRQMIWQGMREAGSGKDLTEAHAEQVYRLFAPDCQSGRKFELSSWQLTAVRQFDKVIIAPWRPDSENRVEEQEKREIRLQEGVFEVPNLGKIAVEILDFSEIENKKGATFLQDIPEKTYTKWLDYDKITESAVFRFRRTGDYLTINTAGAKKSLKRYMIEEKIPADMRDELIILADGSHVIWVPGHRISAAYRITEHTTRVLQINLTGGKENGREN